MKQKAGESKGERKKESERDRAMGEDGSGMEGEGLQKRKTQDSNYYLSLRGNYIESCQSIKAAQGREGERKRDEGGEKKEARGKIQAVGIYCILLSRRWS